jgi:hypothetical protein
MHNIEAAARELSYQVGDGYGKGPKYEDLMGRLLAIALDEQPTDLKPMRYALVSVDIGKVEQLKAYMPGNYEVLGRTPIGASNTVSVLIGGRDSCGWTLDDYVIPRLASGMYYAVEIGGV